MTHIDDFIDDPQTPLWLAEFFDQVRRPAMYKNHTWIATNMPTALWRGRRLLVVGASRLGDVWLREPGTSQGYYDHRVNVDDLSDWQPASAS